jgi:uncharacterized protein (TIGR02594 family)
MSALLAKLKKSSAPVIPISNSPVKVVPTSPAAEYLKWMDIVATQMGIKELLPNGKVNPIITEYFMATAYHTPYNEAWCSAFICWVLRKAGYKTSNSAGAYDNVHLGTPCELQIGCVVVIEHLKGELKGHFHVTFCKALIKDSKGNVIGFIGRGGNQNNCVCDNSYLFADHKVVGSRWPVKA